MSSRAELASTQARAARAAYFQGGGELGIALPIGRAAITLDLSAGWAEGLVLLADRRTALELAGPVLAVSLGARLPP